MLFLPYLPFCVPLSFPLLSRKSHLCLLLPVQSTKGLECFCFFIKGLYIYRTHALQWFWFKTSIQAASLVLAMCPSADPPGSSSWHQPGHVPTWLASAVERPWGSVCKHRGTCWGDAEVHLAAGKPPEGTLKGYDMLLWIHGFLIPWYISITILIHSDTFVYASTLNCTGIKLKIPTL